MVARSENGAKGFEALGQPRAAFSRSTPQADRASRADLVSVANMYFSGMQLNDGKGQYPFAEDCDRIENGGQLHQCAGARRSGQARSEDGEQLLRMWTCREQFESGLLHFVSRIRDRRYVAWTRSAASCWRSSSSTTMRARLGRSRRLTGGR